MLMIFIFSITPKKYLHDLVADHTDFYGYSSHNEQTINTPGLDCEDDDLVVTVPFMEEASAFTLENTSRNSIVYFSFYQYISSKISAANDVRGPPAVIA
jgi:hypothetical protein